MWSYLLYWLLVDMDVERHFGWHYPQVGWVLKLYRSVGVRPQARRRCDVFLSTSDVVWVDAYIPAMSSLKNWAVTQTVTLRKKKNNNLPHLNCFGNLSQYRRKVEEGLGSGEIWRLLWLPPLDLYRTSLLSLKFVLLLDLRFRPFEGPISVFLGEVSKKLSSLSCRSSI